MGAAGRRGNGEEARVRCDTPAHENLQAARLAREAGTAQALDERYMIAAATDVQRTWRKHGWTPPSEQPEYQAKWAAAQQPTRLKDIK